MDLSAQTVLKIAAVSSTGYSAQMLAAPDWANSYYYKAGHPKNENWQRWFGHGLAGMALAQGLASGESTANKAVLLASGAQYVTAPLMMLTQKDDFKPAQIALNSAICLGIGGLCLKAGLKK